MKYVLPMQFAIKGWESGNMGTWPQEDIKANIDFLRSFHKEFSDAGEWVSSEGLGGPEGIKMVQARTDSAPAVTDGPFPESKEFLAGFWIVDVDSPERVIEIAARLSALPGPGRKPANLPIQVRPVMGTHSDIW
jgi:hypothetical protein